MEVFYPQINGLCNGAKRTLEETESLLKGTERLYAYGELIHNKRALKHLGDNLVICSALAEAAGSKLIIRAHGVPPKVYTQCEELDISVIDLTCPFVKSVQQRAKSLHDEGKYVIIIGNSAHPEIIGLKGWAGSRSIVVSNIAEAEKLHFDGPCAVIGQTTLPKAEFEAITAVLMRNLPQLEIVNTLCNAVNLRQEALRELTEFVDLIIVIGDKLSSNTNKLLHICSECHKPAYLVEGADELSNIPLAGIRRIGVAAGASTPQWIIEEVVVMLEEKEMQEEVEEESFAEAYEKGLNMVHTGARVKGVVVRVREGELLVDIGGKSEGILPSAELMRDEAENIKQHFAVGDEIEVLVIKKENKEGYPMLSKKRIDQEIAWEALLKAKEENSVITGKVTEVVKGGLLADVGVRGFIPASMLSINFVESLADYVGKELPMKVIECERRNNKLVLSPKAVMREEAERKKAETWANIAEGQTVSGIVRRLTPFGAFVDIGGVDGLLHISEMAWYRVSKPSDLLKEGDKIDAFVLGVDKENGRISLGLKQLIPNPWSIAAEKYPVNGIFPAKIMRTAPFGAFAELEPGIEGLVHISQISWQRLNKTEDGVKPGDDVNVKILSLDPETKRISLSIKETMDKPADAVVEEVAEPAEEAAPADAE